MTEGTGVVGYGSSLLNTTDGGNVEKVLYIYKKQEVQRTPSSKGQLGGNIEMSHTKCTDWTK